MYNENVKERKCYRCGSNNVSRIYIDFWEDDLMLEENYNCKDCGAYGIFIYDFILKENLNQDKEI